MRVDVTVLGAGVMGLCAAWGVARRGARVRVVDPGAIGAGASGGVVGALSPHAPERWDATKAAQLAALVDAPGFWAEAAAAGGGDPGYARTGRLMPLDGDRAVAQADARSAAAMELWGGAGEWRIEPAPVGWGPGTPRVVRDTLAARLDPRRALAALAAAIVARGGEVVRDADLEGPVIEAIGAARPGVEPVKGQAARLAYAAPDWPQVYAGGIYVVPHADGTTAIGSTSEPGVTDPGPDAALDDLIARARALVPALADAPVVERWAGLRPRGPGGRPLLGTRDGRIVLNGGFRIGFALAPLMGDLAARMVLGESVDIPPDWAP